MAVAQGAQKQQHQRADARFRTQFRRSQLCSFFEAKGHCTKGDRCEFAHGQAQLRLAPDLTKTSLCKRWLKFSCAVPGAECPFAHGWHDLRVTQAYDQRLMAKDDAEDDGSSAAAQSAQSAGLADATTPALCRGAAGGGLRLPAPDVGRPLELSLHACVDTASPAKTVRTNASSDLSTQSPTWSMSSTSYTSSNSLDVWQQLQQLQQLQQQQQQLQLQQQQQMQMQMQMQMQTQQLLQMQMQLQPGPLVQCVQMPPAAAAAPVATAAAWMWQPTPEELEAILRSAMPDHYED